MPEDDHGLRLAARDVRTPGMPDVFGDVARVSPGAIDDEASRRGREG